MHNRRFCDLPLEMQFHYSKIMLFINANIDGLRKIYGERVTKKYLYNKFAINKLNIYETDIFS